MQNLDNNVFVVGFVVVLKSIVNICLKPLRQEYLVLICVSALLFPLLEP